MCAGKRHGVFFACCIAWALGLSLAIPAARRAERLPLKSYTTADGLARDQINRIVRDSRGFLWFCTPEGLSRFDGYRFTNYTLASGLPHRSVRDLLETRSGAYWVATGDGLCRLRLADAFKPPSSSLAFGRPRFTVYRPVENGAARAVRRLYEDRAGRVWVGTVDGLYRLEQTGDQVRFHFVELGMPTATGWRICARARKTWAAFGKSSRRPRAERR